MERKTLRQDNSRDVAPFQVKREGAGTSSGTQEQSNSKPKKRARLRSPGILVTAIVAMLLLVIGGYIGIQQLSANRDQFRPLTDSQSRFSEPSEVAASKDSLRKLEEENAKQAVTIEILSLYNTRLSETVKRLEEQLSAGTIKSETEQVESVQAESKQANSEPGDSELAESEQNVKADNTVEIAAKEATSSQGIANAEGEGRWFVNFGSYNRRSAAEKWVTKLSPIAGKTIVTAADSGDKTFYRVRVIGLADREQAEKVADLLQTTHNLPPLWVGID